MVDSNSPGGRTQTEVTCDSCKKPTTVPFTPTPGRPVYCRDCFTKRQAAGGPSGGGGRRGPPRSRAAAGGGPSGKQKMMQQGRKTHFLYDAREILGRNDEGAMESAHHRAFLEGLFARGARGGTQDAQAYLDEKRDEGLISDDEHGALIRLVNRYSSYR